MGGPQLTRRELADAYRTGSAYWRLGIQSDYVWRRNDPERDQIIAAERAQSAEKSAAAKARRAKRTDIQPRSSGKFMAAEDVIKGRDWSDCRTCEGPLAALKEAISQAN